MMEAAINLAANANAALNGAQRELQEEIARLNDLRIQIANLEQQRSARQEKRDREAASAIIDGNDPPEPTSAELRSLAALNRKIAASKAAIPQIETRIAERRRAVDGAQSPLSEACVRVVLALQQPAIEQIRELLGQMREPLIGLLASDMVGRSMLGDQYVVPSDSEPPVKGQIIVDRLVGHLPTRLAAAVSIADLRAAAASRAQRIFRSIEGVN